MGSTSSATTTAGEGSDPDEDQRAGLPDKRIGLPTEISRGVRLDGGSVTTAEGSDAAEKGRRLFGLAVEGRWEEVRADFDERMLAGLSIDMLAAGWDQVVHLVGPFRSFGEPAVRMIGEHTVVELPISFERGEMKGRVAIAPSAEVAGFFILKPEAP